MASTPLPTKIRSTVGLALGPLAVAFLAAGVAAQAPTCADALHEGEPMGWDTAKLIAADLTLDGFMDAAYWWLDGSQVVVLIGTCLGTDVARRWRFVFDVPADCPAPTIRAEAASLLLDDALVDRACAGERSASECTHLRRENARRQALMDAGGRALRIAGPSCTVALLRWRPELNGFMRIR